MSRRLILSVSLSCAVLLPAGCCGKAKLAAVEEEKLDLKEVTLHVKDMAERLDLL